MFLVELDAYWSARHEVLIGKFIGPQWLYSERVVLRKQLLVPRQDVAYRKAILRTIVVSFSVKPVSLGPYFLAIGRGVAAEQLVGVHTNLLDDTCLTARTVFVNHVCCRHRRGLLDLFASVNLLKLALSVSR